jgi:hypothetical protein
MDRDWFKSSYSASNNCIEVAFHKSSYCANTDCVEVAAAAERDELVVLVRDSKNQDGPVLEFTRHEWGAFLAGVRNGEFDLESR